MAREKSMVYVMARDIFRVGIGICRENLIMRRPGCRRRGLDEATARAVGL
jgi:hypothetical protein